jgi:uncharacterized Rmd1/YagE family protein
MNNVFNLLTELPESLSYRFATRNKFVAKAMLLGKQIQIRKISKVMTSQLEPIVWLIAEDVVCVAFHFGAIVLFNADVATENQVIQQLQPYIGQPYTQYLTETMEVAVAPESFEGVFNNIIHIKLVSKEHLELIADVLAKSITLDLFELHIRDNFNYVEPVARNLISKGTLNINSTELLKHIGGSLLAQHDMIGKIEVSEKPTLLWEHTHLEHLHSQLSDELEIQERQKLLNHKIDLITRTAQTSLEVLQHRHASRLEWYIIILILVSIFIETYAVFAH